MSTFWDLKCLDCGKDSGFSNGNRAHRSLLQIAKLRPQLEALGLACKPLEPLDWLVEETISRWAGFYAEHVGHVVVVHSEYYNDAYFGCSKAVESGVYIRDPGPRENTHECRLDQSHAGPCSRTRPDGQ